MAEPIFSVIIPVFNKWELTRDCLRSLREHTPGEGFEVLVADNGSSDETVEALLPLGRELFGRRFTLARFDQNRNFGPACNAAAEVAGAPLLFFLNNDTLLTANWAQPLIDALAEDASLGAVGPLLLYGNDTVQHLGVAVAASGVMHLYRNFPASHPVVKKRRYCQMITAAALMLPRKFFFDCGGFYEEYVNGFEDVDLCVRIGERGGHLRSVPESVVYHLESQSPGRNDKERHNSLVLTRRCGGQIRVDLHRHALADGFAVGVNDLFEINLALKPEEEALFTRAAQDKPAPFWLELVRQHPLWISGRETLAEALEAQGHFEEALSFRANLADTLCTEDAFRRYMRAAARARDNEAFIRAKSVLNLIIRHRSDRQFAEQAMNWALRRLPASGEEELKALFQARFAAMHS